MEPIRYVDALNNKYGSMGFPPYQWSENDSAPWTPMIKPLAECTVAMLVSGGISLCSAAPFDADARNDHRLDAVDPATPSDQQADPRHGQFRQRDLRQAGRYGVQRSLRLRVLPPAVRI